MCFQRVEAGLHCLAHFVNPSIRFKTRASPRGIDRGRSLGVICNRTTLLCTQHWQRPANRKRAPVRQPYLGCRREEAVDVIDLILEPTRQHLVRLIQNQLYATKIVVMIASSTPSPVAQRAHAMGLSVIHSLATSQCTLAQRLITLHPYPDRAHVTITSQCTHQLHGASAEILALDHVEDAAWRTRHDVNPMVELADVLANARASDAGVALNVHVVPERQDHL